MNVDIDLAESLREIFNTPHTFDRVEQEKIRADALPITPMCKLLMRMHWGVFGPVNQQTFMRAAIPFDHLSIHLGAEKAIVFVVKDGEPITLEDPSGMFPSDTLVGQLRLLEQASLPKD